MRDLWRAWRIRDSRSLLFGELVGGTGCVGGQEKEWMECVLDGLRACGINADQKTTAAQGMTQNNGTRDGTFHDQIDRCSGSQGWTTACSRMRERDGKDQGEDSPKQAGSCWFARSC